MFQQILGSTTQCNKAIKRNKRHPDWEKKFLFAGDAIFYVKTLMASTKNLEVLISEFNKFAE